MSLATDYEKETLSDEGFDAYRSVSKTAVISAVLAVLSLLSFILPIMLILPMAGFVFGLMSLRSFQRFPKELSGRPAAWLGLAASGLIFVGAISAHIYVYLTEVPEGYERLAFSQLRSPTPSPNIQLPQAAVDSNGKAVFVKGYMHPGVAQFGDVRQFVLVPDMKTCCFGGQPELTDMIEVTLVGSHSAHYGRRMFSLGGRFRVSNSVRSVVGNLQGGIYELEADYVK